MVAIGKDAIFLNKEFKLKVTCMKRSLCKVGMPVSHILKYTDLMDSIGYGYVLYDYNVETKQFQRKYSHEGKLNPETEKSLDCKNCKYYKGQGSFDNVYIFDILEQREKERKEKEELERKCNNQDE